jgi:Holliday junction resolvase RusA-like endonuclease
MKNIIQLSIPVLLNNLYIPVVKYKNGRPYPAIVKSKDAREYVKYVKMQCLRQKVQLLKGTKISFQMDILIKDRKDFDIDAPKKLLYDVLQGIAYVDDRYIVEEITRKHLGAEKDGLNILIKEL